MQEPWSATAIRGTQLAILANDAHTVKTQVSALHDYHIHRARMTISSDHNQTVHNLWENLLTYRTRACSMQLCMHSSNHVHATTMLSQPWGANHDFM